MNALEGTLTLMSMGVVCNAWRFSHGHDGQYTDWSKHHFFGSIWIRVGCIRFVAKLRSTNVYHCHTLTFYLGSLIQFRLLSLERYILLPGEEKKSANTKQQSFNKCSAVSVYHLDLLRLINLNWLTKFPTTHPE